MATRKAKKVKATEPTKTVPPAPTEEKLDTWVDRLAGAIVLLNIVNVLMETPDEAFQTILDTPDGHAKKMTRPGALESVKEQTRILLTAKQSLKALLQKRQEELKAA